MTCLRSSRLVWCPIWWQVHALRARINSFSFPQPSQWVWNSLYNGKRRNTRLIRNEASPFCLAFFQSIFSPVCADWSAVRATCFPLSIPSPKYNMVSNSATCSVSARGRTIWEHATRWNFNRTTNSHRRFQSVWGWTTLTPKSCISWQIKLLQAVTWMCANVRNPRICSLKDKSKVRGDFWHDFR